MKVNCVVVTYNRLALLRECLAAIEKQTYPIHKVIVIDNCSTDGTEDFLKAYAVRHPHGTEYRRSRRFLFRRKNIRIRRRRLHMDDG